MINIELNGEVFKVIQNETIIQSCSRIGEEIPRFCFHEQLSVAGNCRMCLVELGFPKSLKPVASCALPIIPNMKIFTNTILVKKARESVLEFLLANHPLDCPICDQGGECDLQDETMLFGNDRGRFYEQKRSVEDKECGPIIKTVMTRCIHCTRCVRFFSEIVGVDFFGAIGRGSSMEIGTFIEKMVDSEISGNVIDLCPVGALTSKPYSFKARPWELRTHQTIDVLDSMCSSIRIDVRGTEVMRILPITDNISNEDWISDKTRFFYDGLQRQRLQYPLFKWNNKFFVGSWEKIFFIFKNLLKFFLLFARNQYSFFQLNNKSKFALKTLIGRLTDIETLISIKDFLNALGNENFFLLTKSLQSCDFKFMYLFNTFLNYTKISNFFNKIDICVLFDFNPRLELPLLNVRLRRAVVENKLLVLSISSFYHLNYFFFHLSNHFRSFLRILEGKHFFCRKLIVSKFPLFLTSSNIFYKTYGQSYTMNLISILSKYISSLVNDKWFGYNIIITYSSLLSAFELGLTHSKFSDNSFFSDSTFFYFLGSENISKKLIKKLNNNFFVYQGHHGDDLTKIADIVLPSSTFIEKVSTFFSFEGYIKKTKQILTIPGMAREDWQIIVSFFLYLNDSFLQQTLFSKNLKKCSIDVIVRKINSRLREISPSFVSIVHPADDFYYDLNFYLTSSVIFYNSLLFYKDTDFFMTDSITRSSEILSLCSQRLYFKHNFF